MDQGPIRIFMNILLSLWAAANSKFGDARKEKNVLDRKGWGAGFSLSIFAT